MDTIQELYEKYSYNVLVFLWFHQAVIDSFLCEDTMAYV